MASNDDKHEMVMEMLKKIAETQEESKDAVFKLDKKVDLHIQKTEFELAKINQLDEVQNKLLDQHIEGVNTLKKWCDQHEEANKAQFQKLEEPRKWIATTVKVMIALGSIATALIAVFSLIKYLQG